MSRIVFLGTSRALPTRYRDNTSILFEADDDAVLVDCGGKSFQSLLNCEAKLDVLNTVLISHAHVDHCYGLPSLLCSLWLSGRQRPLAVLGLPETIEKIQPIARLYGWPNDWKSTPPIYDVRFEPLRPEVDGSIIYEGPGLTVKACANRHAIANVATKVHFRKSNLTVVYSSDTSEPTERMIEFSREADWLIHEASFMSGMEAIARSAGHSTPPQVGELANAVMPKRLYLVHHGLDSEEDISRMKAEVRAKGFPIYVPDDMESVAIG